MEIKSKSISSFSELGNIDWKKTLPFKNRTVIRMLTISTGTFTTFDMADAAIRGAVKSEGDLAVFAKNFILRVNFVGIGRFAIAVWSDVSMGVKRSKIRNERMDLMSRAIMLLNAKVYYNVSGMWIAAENTRESIEIVERTMIQAIAFFKESSNDISNNISEIDRLLPNVQKKNPVLIEEMDDLLNW